MIPVRIETSQRSEMINQLLFGETFDVVYRQQQWARIKSHLDGYEGWVEEKQVTPLHPITSTQKKSTAYSVDIVQSAISSDLHIPILIGSTLHNFDGLNFLINKKKFVFNGHAISPDQVTEPARLLRKIALKFLHAPYLWGGRSPFGVDCSGLVQVAFKILGYDLPRDAYQQADVGEIVNLVGEAREGDVAFFDNPDGKIIHVGIVLADQQIIHASGQVRIDRLDHYGIYNSGTRKYSHKLRIIKRVL